MKKTYIYFLVPLLGLIVFGAIFWNFNAGYEARLAERAKVVREQREEKLRIEAQNREKAIKDAVAAQERRKAEKAAKEAKDQKDRDERQALEEEMNKANRDQFKLQQQVQHLEGEIKAEHEAIAKIEDDRKAALAEQGFLQGYVKQAEANSASLRQVIEKIAAADAARAQAEALAAKNKNS